jgi:leucyl aminopeptidase
VFALYPSAGDGEMTPIVLISQNDYPLWLSQQPAATQAWLVNTQFRPEAGAVRLIPDSSGKISQVLCCVADKNHFWNVGHLPFALPEGMYTLGKAQTIHHAIAWGLGAYQFTRYKKPQRQAAQLNISAEENAQVKSMVEALCHVRDWINTPTDDMGPSEFAEIAKQLAKAHHAKFSQIVGEELLAKNYASIYTVGRASDDAPRLIDLRWGNAKHPKLSLVGKGVCFDTGGLDIKSSSYMLLMKKDMAGGAHVLGLARMIMEAKLPVCLRVLIPMVENAISGNAYRPGDVIKSRKGTTIEVGNTDAEGRLILADALTEAASENPDLLVDISTLTGAARVALGTELPAVFSNHDAVVEAVIKHGEKVTDPMWRLPLFGLYREYLNSNVADLNNNPSESYGGAITAALFLKEFVPDTIPWLHFDLMAWNLRTRPGRPQGGEAMVLRALFSYLQEWSGG